MVLNTLVPSLLISAPLGASPMRPQALTIHNGFAEACVKSVKHALQCAKYSGADPQLTLLALQATPIDAKLPSLPSSCTNTSLGPPFLPKSVTLTQQPSKFMNRLTPTLTPTDHRLINTANLLHPCMWVSQLPCTIPFARFGSPLQWYAYYIRTATRYAPGMVLFTTAQDNTHMNAVSSPLTLFQVPQQPHHRFLPSLHNQHSICLLHPQHLQLQSHRPQLSPPCQLSQRSPLHLCLQHPV